MIWLAASLALASPTERYAVVIGADTGLAEDGPLMYAERDAERVADVLRRLGGVRAEDLVLLRGEDADSVRGALAATARRATDEGDARSVLVVYYSGHGDASSLHLGGTALPLTELKAAVEAVPVDMRLLVVDACQSGELTRLKGVVPAEPFEIVVDDRLHSEGLAILTSSSPGEDAQESDTLGGGVFTHHWVTGLLGAADASGDGRVTLGEAFGYSRAQTIRSTSRARFVQHPTYDFDLRGEAELILTTLEADDRRGQLVLADPGTWMVFEGRRDGDLVAQAGVPGGGQLSVGAGPYLVRLREDAAVRELSVDVGRGESVLVERAAMAVVPYGQTVRRGLAPERRSALAVTAGAGVVGPVLPGLGAGPLGGLGLRLDLAALSVGVRGHGAVHASSNDSLMLRQRRAGLDLELVKRLDTGRLAPGIGVRLGTDVLLQRFETPGQAPSRSGVVGRLGPALGTDLAVGPRLTLALSGGVDVQAYRDLDDAWATVPIPHAMLEVVAYAR